MAETLKVKKYERKIPPLRCIFSRSLYSIVAAVAQIKRELSENKLMGMEG